MLARDLSVQEVGEYFRELLPPAHTDREKKNRSKALGQLTGNFDNERNTLGGMRGTAWAALNAATEFADHQRRFKGKDERARAESRLDSVWFGSSAELKAVVAMTVAHPSSGCALWPGDE
jgi:hypothetical protein